jgi:translocation and assembly module TamB
MQANIRGELASPQVFGALELKNATLNVEGLPNGLDKVSGRVLFDRRRATIENKLTAESGGGGLALSGFIDFSGEDTFYRLQAEAARVRIRYPEGVSTVADANISLSGTTERSLLAGTVTVLRSGFTPRTDIGSLLAESSRVQSTPKEGNKFLANMQIDVKVRTAPETQFTTSLTNDLQAEANLQIRGTGARPVALGRITISQGDINFFGNKYSIKRGEVSFYNPTKVEPTLDLDLETRVRGVDVTVNFTGPIDKLNVSYRSDPPLQPGEIIALLTVGRSPTASTVGSSQSGATGSFLQSGANSLLGSAISAPISSQLQRFFGVSRIKIDPTIAGLEGTPQARVTVEQQVSKDVTITFVTNLNRSQQQVVRFEWNLSKEWSLIALRDENGAFGVDFQVRKQVK